MFSEQFQSDIGNQPNKPGKKHVRLHPAHVVQPCVILNIVGINIFMFTSLKTLPSFAITGLCPD